MIVEMITAAISYNIILMMMESHRKDSQDFYNDSQDESSNMFPRMNNNDLQATMIFLQQHYNKNIHSFELGNYCFRCHNPQFFEAYSKFRLAKHPQLQQPQISNLYDNSAFVDLKQFGKRIQKQNLQFPWPTIGPVPKNILQIMNQLFQQNGYIPNFERFLLYYPTYLEKHVFIENAIFQSDKVDTKIAYFLALCGAAEVGSSYMIARWLKKFLRGGGQLQWITEGKYPKKLNSIIILSRLMNRASWLITTDTIQQILQNQNFHFSPNQLAVYIQILAYSHQNSTIALAIGLLPQDPSNLHNLNLQKIIDIKNEYDSKFYESSSQFKQKLAQIIPLFQQIDNNEGENESKSEFKKQIAMSNRVLKKSMRKQQFIDTYMKEIGNQLNKQQMTQKISKLLQPLLPPLHVLQKRNEKVHPNLDYSQYNYKFMAYPILHNLTQSLADRIQNLIAYSQIMTRGNFGSEKLNNTKQFRKAVRYYAQNLCGYTHQQYDFKSNVGAFLTMALKFYIRLLMISPIHINKQVIRETNHQNGQIECFDLGHLALIIANTKMSLQLTLTIQAFEL